MNAPKKSGAGRPKSEEKREKILAAASECFLEQGFIGTSMDLVAKQANVSKQTVYSHFENKDTLYCEIIKNKCSEYQLDEAHTSHCDELPEIVLTRIGQQFLQLLLDPNSIAMYKMLIGEVGSNEHVSELFYNSGTRRGIRLLATYLNQQEQYHISEATAWELSTMFFNTVKGEYHMKSLLKVPQDIIEEELQAHVTRTVTRILLCLDYESSQTTKPNEQIA